MTRKKEFTIRQLDFGSETRVLRLGVGKYSGTWFVRIDLWNRGFRFSFV